MSDKRIRMNYRAVVVATIACFFFEAAWYAVFINAWMAGTGRTLEWYRATGMSPWVQHLVAVAVTALVAMSLSCVVQATGESTAIRGIRVAAMLWAGFVLPVWALEYIYEVRPWSLFGINAGFWLLGMMLMGSIVGGWKAKA
ncbi:MAG: DUF1761 domain-containing protein [Acidobacteriota bacterium]